jgi:hypothetical protein
VHGTLRLRFRVAISAHGVCLPTVQRQIEEDELMLILRLLAEDAAAAVPLLVEWDDKQRNQPS